MSKDVNSGPGKLWSGRQEQPEPQPTRQRPGEEKVVSLHPPDRTYKAFDTRDRNSERLHIRCATQPSRFPAYSYLLDIIFEHDFDAAFTLVYSFMVVEVTGENLGQVVHAIYYGNCECIREFHTKHYDRPAKGEPIIESVRIVAAAPPARAPEKARVPAEG